MSLKTKTRIVVATLLVLAVWPLSHRAIVHMTDMSPWKGFGWAMYCVPKRLIAIQGNPTELLAEQPAQVPIEVQRVIDRATHKYIERRTALG